MSSSFTARIAVNAAFTAGLAAMAVSAADACPLDVEVDHEVSWWSSWHVRMRQPRPRTPQVPVAPKPRAIAKVTAVTTAGPLAEAVVRRLVKREASELARCYDHAFLGEPLPPKLELRLTFRIATAGGPTNIAVAGADRLASCVTNVISTLAIPRGAESDTFADVRVTLE
jgi:hypothetical protein